MEINAITVCVNYSHLFKHCLGNKRFFKRWIIVTAEDDLDTINLCKENNLEFIISKTIYDRQFFKSGAINEAFNYLGTDKDWYLLIDSDILLPDNFFDFIEENENGEKEITGIRMIKHGIDEVIVPHTESIINPKSNDIFTLGRVNVFEDEDFNNFDPDYYFSLMDHIIQHFKAYGYFQLFNMKKLKETYKYLHDIHPTLSNNAGHDDYFFKKMFSKVISLNQHCVHLSHEGVNWDGINKEL